jgi:hypothetical protein
MDDVAMDYDLSAFLILVVLLLAPAIVVFTIVTVIRIRRGKFHRERVKRSKDEE